MAVQDLPCYANVFCIVSNSRRGRTSFFAGKRAERLKESGLKDRGLGTPLLGHAPDPWRKFRSRSQSTAPRLARRGQWNLWLPPKAEQMPPSKTSTNMPSREYIRQETVTLDKDRHDRVIWLCGHNRVQNSGRAGNMLCPSHEHEGGTDGNRKHCGQR